MSTVMKNASDLRVGDKILGGENWFVIKQITRSPYGGVRFPVIHLEDRNGVLRNIDTGASAKLQDHLYEIQSD